MLDPGLHRWVGFKFSEMCTIKLGPALLVMSQIPEAA